MLFRYFFPSPLTNRLLHSSFSRRYNSISWANVERVRERKPKRGENFAKCCKVNMGDASSFHLFIWFIYFLASVIFFIFYMEK
jgi:hypothetical protein